MHIRISIPAQTLELLSDLGDLLKRYSISTASNGAGERNGSYCTPRGRHIIRAKIGADQPANTVFVRRRATGEICSPELMREYPGRDWILSRILWLSGHEPGFNRHGQVDTMRRYIYLHGSPDSVAMGKPGSIGCVRMRNADIIELFDLVAPYTKVNIVEYRIEEGAWRGVKDLVHSVRSQVYIDELSMPSYTLHDDWDKTATHVVAYDSDGETVGVGRLLGGGHISHMAVLPTWRQRGVGRALLERLLEAALNRKINALTLDAKTHVADFYEKFGFVKEGEVFVIADKPHIRMVRQTQP